MNGNGSPATVRLKFLASKVGSGKTPLGGSQVYQDSGVLFIRSQNVHDDGLRLDDAVFIGEEIDEEMAISRVQAGDVLMNITGASIGRVCAVPLETQRANVNQHVCIIRPRSSADSRFLAYSLQSGFGRSQVFASEVGVSREGLTFEQVGNLQIPAVENKQQTRVASFLDAKLGRLDELMRKKKRQLALLAEKRQALISHAVTRGLNANAPTKHSGIEWLGKIPAHWQAKRIKYCFQFLDYLRIPLSSEERSTRQGPFPYYGASGIIDSIDSFLFDEPLLLFGEDGANLVFRSTPLAFVASGKYWVNNHAHILKPKFGALSYWGHALNLLDVRPSVTGAAQPKLTAEALGNIAIPAPPTEEQIQIGQHLSVIETAMRNLVGKIETQVTKLHEYRQALITAAVTGQVAIPEAAA